MQEKKIRKRVGALWEKVSKKGDSYFSGVLNIPEVPGGEIKIILFKTKEKKTDKSPDWQIYEKDEEPSKPTSLPAESSLQSELLDLDEIPF